MCDFLLSTSCICVFLTFYCVCFSLHLLVSVSHVYLLWSCACSLCLLYAHFILCGLLFVVVDFDFLLDFLLPAFCCLYLGSAHH